MTRALVLEIGQIRIGATGLPEDADRIETTLREGLRLLAERLAASPFARDPQAMAVAVEQMQIDSLSLDDWLDGRGAARVADLMYRRIAAQGYP